MQPVSSATMLPGMVGIGLIVAPGKPEQQWSDDERQRQCGGVVQAHQGRRSSGDAQPVVEAVTVP
jgi:hypothetical protein